jgi:hypothetical protein
VVAAHLEDLRLTDGIVFLMFLRWMDEIEKEELVYKEVCSSYLPLLLTWYILLGLVSGGCVSGSIASEEVEFV